MRSAQQAMLFEQHTGDQKGVVRIFPCVRSAVQAMVFEHHTDDQYGSKRKTKVTRNIDKLKKQGHIGFIDSKRHMLSRSIKSADLIHPNHDVLLCEVKEVVKKLLELP